MPSKKSSSKKSSEGSSKSSGQKSNYQYHKEAGGYNNFMHSHGLKPWDDDDVQEGKAILDAFREYDRQDAEAQGKSG